MRTISGVVVVTSLVCPVGAAACAAGIHHTATDPKHPLLHGEFADLRGRRYVMLVNSSRTQSVRAAVTFLGKDMGVHSWGWDGEETESRTRRGTRARSAYRRKSSP